MLYSLCYQLIPKRAEADKTNHAPVSYPVANYAHSPQVTSLMDMDPKPWIQAMDPSASVTVAPPTDDQVLAQSRHVRLAKID